MNKLYLIPSGGVVHYWPRISVYLDRARGDRPSMSLDHIRRLAEEGSVQCWAACDDSDIFGAGMSEITVYPAYRVVSIRMWSADEDRREDWLALLPTVENWARSIGAAGMEISGRDGWLKLLDKQGYDMKNVTVRKMFDGPIQG